MFSIFLHRAAGFLVRAVEASFLQEVVGE